MHKINFYKFGIGTVYLFLFGGYVFFSILDSSLLNISILATGYRWFALGALILVYFYNSFHRKITIKLFVIEMCVVISFLLVTITTKKNFFVLTALFIITAETTGSKRIVKTHLISVLASLAVVFFLLVTKQIPDYLFGFDSAHCFGFAYFHYVPYHMFFCLLEHLYLREKPLRVFDVGFILVVAYFLHKLTTVSLTFYLTFVLLILYYLIYKYPVVSINKRWITRLSAFVFPIGAFITYYMMVFYNPSSPQWVIINTIANGRLKYMNEGFHRYPITLFGQVVEMQGNSAVRERLGAYFYIDSGFAYSLLGYGVILTIITFIMYDTLFRYSCKQEDKMLFIWLIIIMLFTVSNNIWLSLQYCPVILMFMPAMKNNTIFGLQESIKTKSK